MVLKFVSERLVCREGEEKPVKSFCDLLHCSVKELWLTVSHIIPEAYISKLEIVSALQRNKSNFYKKFLSVNAPENLMDNQLLYILGTQEVTYLTIIIIWVIY